MNRRPRKKIFLLTALKIPYLLLHKYSPDTRRKFSQEYPYLFKFYRSLLELIALELSLPVKYCQRCRISFLPDHRTKGHQKFCPYGCVEINRRENKRKAKSRYNKKHSARMMASEYNRLYRLRKKNGQVATTVQISEKAEMVERKLRAQIKFFYKRLMPQVSAAKIEQLDRILQRLSQKISTSYL